MESMLHTRLPSPIWDGAESVRRLVGSASCLLVNSRHRRDNAAFGERTGSERPLMVGCHLSYIQYLALNKHIRFFLCVWGGVVMCRERVKGMIKVEFSSSLGWSIKRGWENNTSYRGGRYNKANRTSTGWLRLPQMWWYKEKWWKLRNFRMT